MKKLLTGLFLILLSCIAFAQGSSYPSRPVKIVIGFAAGAPTDLLLRALAEGLTKELGQTVIVENRPGAGGTIGAAYVAKSVPDGYTLYMSDMSHAIAASLYRKLPYDSVGDFAGISRISQFRMALVVGSKVTAPDLKTFIALLKTQPDKFSHGSSGNGSSIQVFNEMFLNQFHASALHVPFRGGGEVVQALMGGTVDFAFFPLQIVAPYVKSGQLRCLGIAGPSRSESLPQIPTFADDGYAGFDYLVWNALYAPKGTPKDVIQLLDRAVTAVLQSPDFAAKAKSVGAEVATEIGPKKADALLKSEVQRWAPIVKANGMQAD